MSDADHTVEADDSELERIRRLVAQQRGLAATDSSPLPSPPLSSPPPIAPGGPETPPDHTIEADGDAVERIRAIAAGRVSLDQPPSQPLGPAVVVPTPPDQPPEQPPAPTPEVGGRPLPAARPSLDDVDPADKRKPVPVDAEAWVPPTRSVRPQPKAPPKEPTVRRWRWATLALAVLLVIVVTAWAVVGRGSSAPPAPTVPARDVPAATTIATSEGSSSD